jgi:hypothetical protein
MGLLFTSCFGLSNFEALIYLSSVLLLVYHANDALVLYSILEQY